MARRPPTPVDPTTLVRDCPRRTTSMSWPGPVHEHLDHLCQEAINDGEAETLSRAEMAAALVWSATRAGLVDGLRAYRLAKVGDRLQAVGNVVQIHAHQPGRRLR
jgi:hypothetical protein